MSETNKQQDDLMMTEPVVEPPLGGFHLDEERDRKVWEHWMVEATTQTMETLPEFVRHLIEDYRHDYGTICHAIAAAALGGAHAVETSPQGGITGFQAGAVFWDFYRRWMHNDGPARIVDYNELLYPQFGAKFRTISAETWTWVRDQAQQRLDENGDGGGIVHPEVRAHWEAIVAGIVPFGLEVEP